MYYPKTVPQGLVWLLLGLCGGGTWPALRQAIKSVDFEVFNLGFIVSMSGTGIALLSLLSLPPTRDPPPPPFGPGDWDGLWEALAWEAADSGAATRKAPDAEAVGLDAKSMARAAKKFPERTTAQAATIARENLGRRPFQGLLHCVAERVSVEPDRIGQGTHHLVEDAKRDDLSSPTDTSE